MLNESSLPSVCSVSFVDGEIAVFTPNGEELPATEVKYERDFNDGKGMPGFVWVKLLGLIDDKKQKASREQFYINTEAINNASLPEIEALLQIAAEGFRRNNAFGSSIARRANGHFYRAYTVIAERKKALTMDYFDANYAFSLVPSLDTPAPDTALPSAPVKQKAKRTGQDYVFFVGATILLVLAVSVIVLSARSLLRII